MAKRKAKGKKILGTASALGKVSRYSRNTAVKQTLSIASIAQQLLKVKLELFTELHQHRLKFLKEFITQQDMSGHKKSDIKPETKELDSSSDESQLPQYRYLFFQPKMSLEEELKDIAVDIEKEAEQYVEPDVFADSNEVSSETISEEEPIFWLGQRVELHYYNRIAGIGTIVGFERPLALVEVNELRMNLGARFGHPLPHNPNDWLRTRHGKLRFTTKIIKWEIRDLQYVNRE